MDDLKAGDIPVNPRKIGSVNPGYCFKKAGWSQVGMNKDGRLILLAVSAGVR